MIHVKIVLVRSCSGTKLRGIANGLVGTVSESTYVVRILRQPIIALLLAASVLRLIRFQKLVLDSGTIIDQSISAIPSVQIQR
jgi:hypothetical protein